MKLKNFADVIVDKTIKFAKENGKNIAVTVLAEALDVPITTVPKSTPKESGKPNNMINGYAYPRNAMEAGIESMLNTARKMLYGKDKLEIAKKIFEISKTTDGSTRIYAIKALEKIQDLLLYSEEKKQVALMIAELSSEWSD